MNPLISKKDNEAPVSTMRIYLNLSQQDLCLLTEWMHCGKADSKFLEVFHKFRWEDVLNEMMTDEINAKAFPVQGYLNL